jgi:hypothetical protein
MSEPDPDLAPGSDELPPYLQGGNGPDPAPKQAKPAPVVQLPGTKRVAERKTRHTVDRERLEVDYCAALLSMREIGAKHGISAGRVVQIAKEKGWKRDVRAAARIRAAALLNQPEQASPTGTAPAPQASPTTKPGNPALSVEIDETAKAMAFVRREHRSVIKRGRVLAERLLREVEEANTGPLFLELFEQAMAEADKLDDVPLAVRQLESLKKAAQKLLTLPSRIYGLHKLSIALKNIVGLERQAFDLDAPAGDEIPPPRDSSMSAAEVYAWQAQQRTVSVKP